MWEQIGLTLREEFSDIADVAGLTRIVLRLTLAIVLGGVLGFERERKGKSAGLRTHMLVCLGAAFFVLVPKEAGVDRNDLSRVLQGLVAGIGFLGGATIINYKELGYVKGITSAAGIWLTAAIGVAVGMGREASAVLCTVLAFGILSWLPQIPRDPDSEGTDHDPVPDQRPGQPSEGKPEKKKGQRPLPKK